MTHNKSEVVDVMLGFMKAGIEGSDLTAAVAKRFPEITMGEFMQSWHVIWKSRGDIVDETLPAGAEKKLADLIAARPAA